MHKKMREILQKRKERMDNIKIDTLDTPEKFLPMAKEIVPILAAFVRDIAELREQTTERMNKLDESRPGGRYSTVMHPDEPALWQEYRERYHAMFDPHCTEKFLSRRIDCCQSLGDRDYSAMYAEDTKVSFLMKSKGKAVIVTYSEKPFVEMDHRYTMCLENGEWKIDEIAFRHTNDTKWKVDRYV